MADQIALTLRLSPKLHRQVVAVAREREISAADMIRLAIQDAMAKTVPTPEADPA